MSLYQCSKVEVFADYHQFYIWDSGVDPQAPEQWSDQDVENRAKVAVNVVVVCPIRNTTVPVEVEMYDSEPSCDLNVWDHVVDCSLAIPTGNLQVHECTGGPVLDWKVKPGSYAVRPLFSGLGNVSADGMTGQDKYRVVLWPGTMRPLSVTQSWQAP